MENLTFFPEQLGNAQASLNPVVVSKLRESAELRELRILPLFPLPLLLGVATRQCTLEQCGLGGPRERMEEAGVSGY